MKTIQGKQQAMVAATAAAVTQLIVAWLNSNGYEVSPELNAAITLVLASAAGWLVPIASQIDDIALALAKSYGLDITTVNNWLAVLDDISNDDFEVTGKPANEDN